MNEYEKMKANKLAICAALIGITANALAGYAAVPTNSTSKHDAPQSVKATSVIDPQPALYGAHGTQKDWIPYFNEQGKRMISAPDIYRAVSGPKEILESIREDFEKKWIVTSTRLSWNPNDFVMKLTNPKDVRAKITHNFGSTVVKPTELQVIIPAYSNGATLTRALKSQETVAYLQALFQTKDNAGKIAETLEHLSQRNLDEILIWTPSQYYRRDYPERAVEFFFFDNYDRFYVNGKPVFDGIIGGRSRGVSVNPSSEHAKKLTYSKNPLISSK